MGADLARRLDERRVKCAVRGMEYIAASDLALSGLISRIDFGKMDINIIERITAANSETMVEQGAALADLVVTGLRNIDNGSFQVGPEDIEKYERRTQNAVLMYSVNQGGGRRLRRAWTD